MAKVRIVEVRTYEYDHADFEEGYYLENNANTDQEKLALDKQDIESNKVTASYFDSQPYVSRTFSLIID